MPIKKRALLFVMLPIAALVVLDLIAQIAESTNDGFAGPYREWQIPMELGFEPSQKIRHLGLLSRANAGGYHGKYYPLVISEHAIRIVVLGDSFAFGYGVEASHNWCSLLEVELERQTTANGQPVQAEVLNFGSPRYNTHLEYLLYKHRAREYHPDHLLIVITPDDPANDRFVPNIYDHCPLEAPTGGWIIDSLAKASTLFRTAHDLYCNLVAGTPGYIEAPDQLLDPESYEFRCAMHWLDRLREETASAGIKLTVVTAPRLVTGSAVDVEVQTQEGLDRWLVGRGYRTISLHKQLLPMADEISFAGGHLNYKGNELVAKLVSDNLAEFLVKAAP